jgi:enediyne biosynthesis protein E4
MKNAWLEFKKDPRWTVAIFLFTYLVLGFTILGFNRSPVQVLITIVSVVSLQLIFDYIFFRRFKLPLSALITSMGISILLNYSHDYFVLLVPAFFAIASKYVFTFKGKHIYNPAMFAVVLSLILSRELITPAPAYQWHGELAMALFIITPAVFFFVPRINRLPLILSFMAVFTLQTFLRGIFIKHYLPFETLFFGTITSAPFFLFVFFMITDPATSPNDRKQQIWVGVWLALFDLFYHLFRSYHTFFYAAATLATIRFLMNHFKEAGRAENYAAYFREAFIGSGYYRRAATVLTVGIVGFSVFHFGIRPVVDIKNADFALTKKVIPAFDAPFGNVYERLDPRIQHLAKWLLVSEGIATADFDGDGDQDVFLTNALKVDSARNALFRNDGDFNFTRVPLDMIKEKTEEVEIHGLPANAMFVDYDSDGDQDLFLVYAFGSSVMLQNQLRETGKPAFKDVSAAVGPFDYSISVSANFMDFNRDGQLDLVLANAMTRELPQYKSPTRLNLFKLPEPEYEGDVRMFRFMHESWHQANNGDVNEVYLFDGTKYAKQNSAALGMPETRWSLAMSTGDFDQDGFTDLYVANDFGPDDLYFNRGGVKFEQRKGKVFGSIGRDTYKGMNASVADFDNNGWLDVYVSNVHHALQAEGSLLWMFSKNQTGEIEIKDKATQLGALNEHRFGWGGAAVDLNNDGWQDILQVNGMVDDSVDKKFEECPDFWYINEKLARSPPSIHSYAHRWGDVRGSCIHPNELNRAYLNRGNGKVPQFVDVAEQTGLAEPGVYRGVSSVDLNNDGARDIIVTRLFGPPYVYENKVAVKNHWIGITLVGDATSGCNASGFGSRVQVEYDGPNGRTSQVNEVQTVSGFSAQNDMRVHFGLGTSASTVNARVKWCGQKEITYENLVVDKYHTLKMPTGLRQANRSR